MNFRSIKKALEDELSSFWGSTTPIIWTNTYMEEDEESSTYIVPEIVISDARNIEYGNTNCTKEITGTLSIRVVGEIGVGSGVLWDHADNLNNNFSNKVFNLTHTRMGRIEDLGIFNNRYQVSVLVPFNSFQS